MTTSRAPERLTRLTGGDRGGGLPLPHLFSAILEELLDHGGATTARVSEITESALDYKAATVRMTWPSFEALASDVLDQMKDREIIIQQDETWHLGPAFALGKYMEIVPGGKGHTKDGTTVWEKDEREARSRASHLEQELASLASALSPDGRGLRPVNEGHTVAIRDSAADPKVGQLYPVLVDQHGRILDGKHRLRADPRWVKSKPIQVENDAQAIAIARWANSGTPLPPKVERRIEELVLGAETAQARQRARIRNALLEQAGQDRPLSHNAIAKKFGIEPGKSTYLIGGECQKLIIESIISECPHRFTEKGREAPGRKPAAPATPRGSRPQTLSTGQLEEAIHLGLTTRPAIMQHFGFSEHKARIAENIIKATISDRERLAGHKPASAPPPLPADQQTEAVAQAAAGKLVSGESCDSTDAPAVTGEHEAPVEPVSEHEQFWVRIAVMSPESVARGLRQHMSADNLSTLAKLLREP